MKMTRRTREYLLVIGACVLTVTCIGSTAYAAATADIDKYTPVYPESIQIETVTIEKTHEVSAMNCNVVKVIEPATKVTQVKEEVYSVNPDIIVVPYSKEKQSSEDDSLMLCSTVDSEVVEYISPNGNTYEIDVERLMALYNSDIPILGCDLDTYRGECYVIYDFLVNQMNVENNIACAVIGNCACEGTFGRQQSTHKIFESIDDARRLLDGDAKDIGYGIVQWTTSDRRSSLLAYYESANNSFADFKVASIVAELVCLYEELEEYDIFSSYQQLIAIEDATGRIALDYEAYRKSRQDWTRGDNGVVSLTGDAGSGSKRLKLAYEAHNYFKGFDE